MQRKEIKAEDRRTKCTRSVIRDALKNNCRDWHTVQQTVDRFIRAGLQELLHHGT